MASKYCSVMLRILAVLAVSLGPSQSRDSFADTMTTTVVPQQAEEPPWTECATPLRALHPCMDYLTNYSVPSPSSECCDGFQATVDHALICLCHAWNGDINQLFPYQSVIAFRMVLLLPMQCHVWVPVQGLLQCWFQRIPPMFPPGTPPPVLSTDAAAPSPSPSPLADTYAVSPYPSPSPSPLADTGFPVLIP